MEKTKTVTPRLMTDSICAKGDSVTFANGTWTCHGCGRSFKRSPNKHIYAARKRLPPQERP